jgi:hypothetical protein
VKTNGKEKRAHTRARVPVSYSQRQPMAVQPAAGLSEAKFNYSSCGDSVYPQCLRELYKIPVGTMDKYDPLAGFLACYDMFEYYSYHQ